MSDGEKTELEGLRDLVDRLTAEVDRLARANAELADRLAKLTSWPQLPPTFVPVPYAVPPPSPPPAPQPYTQPYRYDNPPYRIDWDGGLWSV